MKAITINELMIECKKQIELKNGDKTIMISRDDEGNGFHYLWYLFTPAKDVLDKTEVNENIATLEDTIILG